MFTFAYVMYVTAADVTCNKQKQDFTVKTIFLQTDKPSAPQGPILVSELTQDSAKLTWKPPKDDGGCDITAYIIERKDAKRTTWTKMASVDGVTLDYQATNLLIGNSYHFRVTAENEVGQSEPLETSAAVVPKSQFGMSEVLFNSLIKVCLTSVVY